MTGPVLINLQGQIQWRASRSEASQRWMAVCDAMNLVTEADTLDELHSVIHESIQLLLADLLQDNELTSFLAERGWEATHIPSPDDAGDVSFNVPWELVAEGTRGPERRAY